MARIGFVGLGNMGGPMLLNLLKAGHQVSAFDLVESALARAKQAGASVAASAASTAQDAEFFISMLPASRHVEGLYLTPDAEGKTLLDRISKSTVVIDCSTISPQSARKVAEAARARGIEMLDAPVSGGTAGAEKGTLTFIVGGDAKVLERARPILEKMGANIFHAGAQGAGQVAKICNNMLLAIHMTGTAEALALGVANGLDPGVLSEVMKRSSGGNWSLERLQPVSRRDGGSAGLARLHGRISRRPDDQGSRPGDGCRRRHRHGDSDGRAGAQPVSVAQETRERRGARLLEHSEALREGRVTVGMESYCNVNFTGPACSSPVTLSLRTASASPADALVDAALTSVPALRSPASSSGSPAARHRCTAPLQLVQMALRLSAVLRARDDLLTEVTALREADGAELIVVEHLRQERLGRGLGDVRDTGAYVVKIPGVCVAGFAARFVLEPGRPRVCLR